MRGNLDQPGARYWSGVLLGLLIWSLSYGFGLLVFDSELRPIFEVGIWFGKNLVPPMILGIALSYTGRTDLAYSRWMTVNVVFWIGASFLYATNSFHHLLWTDYQIVPILDVAAVSYTRQPLLFVLYAIAYLQVGVSVLLLLETLYTYGKDYTAQILVQPLSLAPPMLASGIWLFQVGPFPELNFAPILFSVTALVLTPLFRNESFEVSPTIVRNKAIEDLPDPFIAVNKEGQLADFNHAAMQLFEGIDETKQDADIGEILPELSGKMDYETPMREEKLSDIEINGGETTQYFNAEASAYRGPRNEIQGTQVVFRDVTQRKQRTQELAETNEQLDQFVSTVSHDLRNPISVARGYLDRAENTGDEADFDTARDAIERMDAMIEELLTVARAETILDEKESVPVAGIATEAWQTARTENATLELTVSEETTVDGDRELLQSIFENLFRNAIDHNDQPVTVEVGTLENADGLYIEDDGTGIPEGERESVFDHGYTRSEDGTGFGLSIVQKFVTAHEWEIQVTNGTGGGARFEIYAETYS
jgi:signal transduction histidine kinase